MMAPQLGYVILGFTPVALLHALHYRRPNCPRVTSTVYLPPLLNVWQVSSSSCYPHSYKL